MPVGSAQLGRRTTRGRPAFAQLSTSADSASSGRRAIIAVQAAAGRSHDELRQIGDSALRALLG